MKLLSYFNRIFEYFFGKKEIKSRCIYCNVEFLTYNTEEKVVCGLGCAMNEFSK